MIAYRVPLVIGVIIHEAMHGSHQKLCIIQLVLAYLYRDEDGNRVEPYDVADTFYVERIRQQKQEQHEVLGVLANLEESTTNTSISDEKAEEGVLDEDAMASILADLDTL
jgi:hypothetical protein